MKEDPRLRALEKATLRLEEDLHQAFPEAFEKVEALVEQRNAYAASLRSNGKFQKGRKAVADANKAIKNYLHDADPRLKELEAARMEIIQGRDK